MANKIEKAYAASKNIYDDTLTQSKWWARLYINFFWNGVRDLEIAQKVLDFIPEDFDGKLLDVPVGTAVFTANRYKQLPAAEIICLDYSRDMLSQARKRFFVQGVHNAQCLQGDVGAMPFEGEYFDILLSMNGFHAFPHKEKAFAETARVLKKGGVFCGCFYIQGESRRTDFIVNHWFSKKGWFTPPFQTMDSLKKILHKYYSNVSIASKGAMVYFKCVK